MTHHEKISSPIQLFLNPYKVEKGEAYTHTTMGMGASSYFIPSSEKNKIIAKLNETVFTKKIPYHLTEKPEYNTIIRVDLDFKFDLDDFERKYNKTFVHSLVSLYNQTIIRILNVEESKVKCFVFQRDAPYKDRGYTKDGIHLMYPFVVCNTDIQHFMRKEILISIEKTIQDLNCKNSKDDVVDKSIISSNNWIMYGCSKPNTKPYELTYIIDAKGKECNTSKYKPKDLIKLLSIRDHCEDDSISLKPEHLEKFTVEIEKMQNRKKAAQQGGQKDKKGHIKKDSVEVNIQDVKKLVKLLSTDRAENYRNWMEVGWCLKNMNHESLLEEWLDFSSKSSKYDREECINLWSDKMGTRESGRIITIRSLYRWAKQDNPKGFEEFQKSSLHNDIITAFSFNGQSQDIAYVVYKMYKYKYKCTSIRHNTWYEFTHHRWTKIDSGVTLKRRIGEEVAPLFKSYIPDLREKRNEVINRVKLKENAVIISLCKELF